MSYDPNEDYTKEYQQSLKLHKSAHERRYDPNENYKDDYQQSLKRHKSTYTSRRRKSSSSSSNNSQMTRDNALKKLMKRLTKKDISENEFKEMFIMALKLYDDKSNLQSLEVTDQNRMKFWCMNRLHFLFYLYKVLVRKYEDVRYISKLTVLGDLLARAIFNLTFIMLKITVWCILTFSQSTIGIFILFIMFCSFCSTDYGYYTVMVGLNVLIKCNIPFAGVVKGTIETVVKGGQLTRHGAVMIVKMLKSIMVYSKQITNGIKSIDGNLEMLQNIIPDAFNKSGEVVIAGVNAGLATAIKSAFFKFSIPLAAGQAVTATQLAELNKNVNKALDLLLDVSKRLERIEQGESRGQLDISQRLQRIEQGQSLIEQGQADIQQSQVVIKRIVNDAIEETKAASHENQLVTEKSFEKMSKSIKHSINSASHKISSQVTEGYAITNKIVTKLEILSNDFDTFAPQIDIKIETLMNKNQEKLIKLIMENVNQGNFEKFQTFLLNTGTPTAMALLNEVSKLLNFGPAAKNLLKYGGTRRRIRKTKRKTRKTRS